MPQIITSRFRVAGLLLSLVALPAGTANAASPLAETQWNHGSENCEANTEPAIEVFRASTASFILRQNKCLSFEAPFIYVLVGEQRALVLDTGATEDAESLPLYDTIRSLVGDAELLIMHSHSHSDHRSGDAQFAGLPGVTVIAPNAEAVHGFLEIDHWPQGEARVDLGQRELIVLPTPGHQEEAITVYDPQTGWLLTGDTLYPGLIYVKDWAAYRTSIGRLTAFAAEQDVTAILGAHIEMTNRAGEYYPVGTLFQPDEAPLPLDVSVLNTLNRELAAAEEQHTIVLDELRVQPMNRLQKTISRIARFLTQ
jgi:glyoxylase-like metal-dependent hydrolase (beta-lactamase superfamily II)